MHVFRRRPFSLQSFANAAQAQPAEYAIPTLSKSASSPRKMATPKPAKSTIRRVGVGAIAVDGSSSTMSGNVASRLRSVEPLPEREAAVVCLQIRGPCDVHCDFIS